MAERPVFIPSEKGRFVYERPVPFRWHAGMSAAQKRRNVAELHRSAEVQGLFPILEISSKSDHEVGRRLSAFHLKMELDGFDRPLESVFQSSKVFENGGPYLDILEFEARDAKRDDRLKNSGRLIGFRLQGRDYPLNPATVFYDWLYIQCIIPHREWLKRLHACIGFTDIEFNPERSVNCQARSVALFVALEMRGELDSAIESFDKFRQTVQRSSF